MKKITLLLAILISSLSFSQVTVGSGTSTAYVASTPINPYYGYSYSQIIYKASDIGASGSITSISFEMSNTDVINNSDDNINLWIGHTTKTEFSSPTDWVDITTLDQKMTDGSLTKSGTTITFTFSTPFVYNGTDNIIIATDANEDGFEGTSDVIVFSDATSNVTIYHRSDSVNADPVTPPSGTLTTNSANITFNGITQSCPSPSALTATSITTSQAELGWTESGTASLYNVEVVIAGIIPTGTATDLGVVNSFTKMGLTPGTDYEFYVQADCTGGDLSAWAGPFSFTTLCVPIDAFNENFDSISTPDLPNCWSSIIDGGASSFAAVTTSTSADNSLANGVSLYNASSSSTSNIMLVAPVLSNLNTGTHRLRFFARSTSSTQDIEVGTLADPSDGSSFTVLEAVDINTSFSEYSVDFSGYSGLDTFIAIRRLSTSTYTYVYLDDIVWEPLPTTPPSCTAISSPADAATNISVTSSLTWSSDLDATGYKLSIGTSTNGTDVLNALDLGDVTSYDLTSVAAYNTIYFATLVSYNTNGDASGCTEISFTTMDGCITPNSPTNGATSASDNPTISWSSVAGATNYYISVGTTSGGTDIVNNFDNGTTTTYSLSGLTYSTEYFVTVSAANANGTTTADCNGYSFTVQGNPNFGGGPDGTDSNNMNSNGYYFANSTANASGAPGQPTYSWIDPVVAGHSQITTWTDDASGGDDSYFTIPDLGFAFNFFDITYQTADAHINSNGAILFGSTSGETDNTASSNSIPSTGEAGDFIAACWMDLDDGADGKVYYGGDANKFVVTWWHYQDYNDSSEYITFQIVLYPNGNIVIQYNDTESTADELGDNSSSSTIYGDALVGIENSTEDKGISYRNNGNGGPLFGSPLALAFTSTPSTLTVQDLDNVSIFSYYPNPVKNTLTLNAQQAITNVSVFNMLGQQVIRNAPNAVTKTLDMSNLQSGAYFVQVTVGTSVETVRIIKN